MTMKGFDLIYIRRRNKYVFFVYGIYYNIDEIIEERTDFEGSPLAFAEEVQAFHSFRQRKPKALA